MRGHPSISPVIARAPALRVQVERPKGDIWESEVGGEVGAFGELVGVGTVAGEAEAFIAEGDLGFGLGDEFGAGWLWIGKVRG